MRRAAASASIDQKPLPGTAAVHATAPALETRTTAAVTFGASGAW